MTASISTLTKCEEETNIQNPKLDKTIRNGIEKITADNQKYKFLFWEFETKIKWSFVISLLLWHILALYFFVTFDFIGHYKTFFTTLVIGVLGGFGVTGGAHRYYTHRAFKAKLPLRFILFFCFTLAGQNSIKDWVRDHRVHHKFSETDADPHNSHRGFWFSHVGWVVMKKHPEVLRKGKQIDISDIFEDPLVVFHQKYFHILRILIAFVLPTLTIHYLCSETWINCIGIVIFMHTINLNSTFSVNSFAHFWGRKPYDKNIRPVENLTVSIFALGEGYHNYHHTFPWDYRAAELGSRINITTLFLNFFHKIGWAYDMKEPSFALVEKVAKNNGDGTHYKWGHEVPFEEAAKIK